MSQDIQVSAIRGAIRTSVTISTESLVAGQPFSIFVTMTNPYEVPISIHRVSTSLPTELVDLNQEIREREVAELEANLREISEAGRLVGLESNVRVPQRRSGLTRLLEGFQFSFLGTHVKFPNRSHLGQAVARDLGGTTSVVEAGVNVPVLGSVTTIKREMKNDQPNEEEKARWRDHLRKEQKRHEEALEELSKPASSPAVLQSGNSTVRSFTLCSKSHIWFRPAPYKLHMEIGYEISGVRHIDTVEYELQLRASLGSMVAGSLIGSTAGWFIGRSDDLTLNLAALISWAVSAILGAMSVVVFARKKDVQPIIAVEDFWGGVALGFLVAYSGPAILEEILPEQAALPASPEPRAVGA